MAKKFFIIMAIVCVGLIAFVGWFRFYSDRTGPEIQCSDTDLVYRDGMSDLELLENVTAFDEKDGDVSASLAVESVYSVDDGTMVVTYVAKDNSNNITKFSQIYAYDEQDSGEAADENAENDAESNVEEASSENGTDAENTDSAAEGSDTNTAVDSAEAEQARQEQEEAAAQMSAECPRIYMYDYIVKVPVGSTVDRLSYVKEITDDSDNIYDLWTKIQIAGTLDTLTAGTYECTYSVVDSQGNASNQAVVRFIVE